MIIPIAETSRVDEQDVPARFVEILPLQQQAHAGFRSLPHRFSFDSASLLSHGEFELNFWPKRGKSSWSGRLALELR